VIKYLLVLLLLALPLISHAANRYALPTGSGTACSDGSPCTLATAISQAVAGDTVWLKNGTYTQSFKTVRGGTSNSARITFKALDRHQAIVRFGPSTHTHFHVDHSWITVSGLRINATSSGGSHAHDASKISDGNDKHAAIQGVIFEDNYVHDSGHLLLWSGNTTGVGVEVRNSTFDMSGHDAHQGEANYMGSCCGKQNPGVMNSHHNIFSRYKANGVDFKGESREIYFHDNFFMDQGFFSCTCGNSNCQDPNGNCLNNHTGDGTFVIGADSGDGSDSSTNNRVIDNVIWRPRSKTIFAFVDPVQVRANGNAIVDWVPTSGTSDPQLNGGSSQHYASSPTYSNIHCPSEGMAQGLQTNGSNPANQINRPQPECDTRIDAIVGKPAMASCNIGDINDNTVTVDIQTTKNGPVSSISANLEVTYNGTNQSGETTTQFSGNQARIAVVTPPANDAVEVRVVAPGGAIHNSAFIGGMNCSNGDNFGNVNYTRGAGFCGENVAQTLLCTNTTEGVGPPPLTEALDQAVWRFYAMHNAEGASSIAPENTDITKRKGGEFRWRVGVRGGGNDAPSRSYRLAARVCKPGPICGAWLTVGSDPNVGVVFLDDLVQDHGTATTNQLALGGKTFLPGIFIDSPTATPATAITTTQQIEWEFGLQIPTETAAVEVGDFIQLRMQHDTGSGLSAYLYAAITILEAGAASYSGSITGSIK